MTSPADTQHCQDVRIACKRPQAANASLQKALSLPTSEPPNEADPTRRKIQLQPFQPTAKRSRTRLQSPSDLNDTEGNANLAPTSTNLQGESSVPVRNPDGTRVQPATVTSTHHLTETSPFGARLHTAKPFARFSVRRPLLEPFTRHTPHPAHRGAAVKADNGPRQQPKLASPFVQFKPRASFSPVPSQQQQPMPQTCQGGKATSRTANGSPDLETMLRKTASGAVNRTSSTSHIEETGESQRSHDPPEHANEPERSSTRRSGSKEQITYKASSVPLSSLDQQQDMPEQVISLQHAQQNSPEPQVQFVRETRAPTQHSFSIEKRNHRTPLPSREALFRSAKRRIGLRVSCSPRCSSPAAAPLQRNPEQSPPPKRLRRLEPLPAREKPSSRSCRSGSPTSPRKSCSGPQSSLRPNPSPRRIKSPSPLRRSPTRNAQTPNRPHHPSRTPPNYRHHSRLTPNSNYRSAIAEKNVRNPSPLLMTRSRTPSRPRYRSRTPSPRRPRSRTPTNYFRGRRTRSPPSPKYRASSQRGNRTHTQPKTNRCSSEPSRYGRRSPSPPRSIHRSRTPPRYGRRSYRSLRRIGGSRSRSRHRSRSRASPRRSISPRSRSPSRHSCHFRSPPRRSRRSRSRSRHGYRSRTPSRRIHRSRSRSMYGCRSRTPSRRIRRSRSRSSRGRRYPNLTRTCACYRSPSWHGRRSRSQPRSISPSRARSRRRRRFQTPPRRSSLSRSASPNGRRSCTPRRNGKRFHTSPRHSRSRSGAHSRDTSRSRTTPWLNHSSRISPRQTRAPPVPNYSSPARRTFTRKDDGDKDKSQTHSLDRPLRTEQPLPLKNSANGMQSTRNSAAGPIYERRDCDNHKRKVQDKTEIIVIDSPGASGIAKPLQQSYTLQHVPSLKPVFEREKVQEAESAVPSGFKLSSLSLRQSNSDKAETVHLSSEIVVVDSPEGLKPPTPNQKLTKRRYEPRPTPAWMQTQKRPRLLSSPTKPRNHATSASGLPRDQANPGRWHDPKPTPPQQTRDTHVSKIPRGPRPLVEDHRTTLKFPGTALKEDLPKHKTDDISKLLLRPSSPSMKFKNEPKSSLANKTTTSNQFDVPSSDRATSTLPARTETANTNSCRETKRPMHLPAHTPSRVPTTLAAISGKTKKTHPLKTTHPPVPAKQEKVVVSGHSTVARPKEDHRFIAMLRQQPTTRSGTPLPRTVIPFDPFSMGSSSVRDSRKRLNVTKERTNAKELPTRDTKASYEFSDDPQITRLMLEYGLHVVERDEESNEVIWLACKFCICFTEVNRWLRNVKMFKTPFTEAGFKDHAKSVHDSVWSTYELAPSEAKEKLFEGRTLPSELLVSLRTGDLKQEDKRDTVTKGQRTAVGTCDIVRKEKIDEYRKIAQEEFKRNEESLKLLKESIPNPQEEA